MKIASSIIRHWRQIARPIAALLVMAAVALPGEVSAQAQPADRLQVLFLGSTVGPHQPFVRAKEILPVLAANGMDMFYSDDPADLNTDNLKSYHALIFYNNQPTISPDQLQALLAFVENGGGLSVIHSGSASFQNSEEFIRLVGGAFKSHGTGTFGVTRLAADHPAIRGVPAFQSFDETYVHTKFNPVDRTILEVRSENGHDEPWTWVRTYGRGRIFYTAWGHDQRTWGTDGFQKELVQGTKWAAGDWALTRQPNEPRPATIRLEVPLPTYAVLPAPWNTLTEPIREAQAPITADESIALTTLRDGFSMKLFAQDPMIRRIMDFTWDERGRLWAVESNDYPNVLLPDSARGGDRVLVLEDTDGDGMADKSTVFAEGFNLASTLALINGGVVVAAAPNFFFLRDTNGDDRADTKELIMTGWPRNDTHGTPSNFRYNFDNQVLASVGYNGFRGTVGGKTWGQGEFASGYFTFTPDGQNLDYLGRTSNNTWGVALSEDGYVFGSTANNRPSNFVHIPARYYASMGVGAPILPGIEDRQDIYPNHAILQVDQFGWYTAGAGHEIYTARAFPQDYWNRKAFVTEPTGNLIGMFDLRPSGTTYQAKNMWSFLMSRDSYMAPVQAKVGPDGSLWISDFNTLVAQHNPYVDMPSGECCARGEGNAYETPNRNKTRGRIYRITHDAAPAYRPIRLDNATPVQLVNTLRNDNMFWRYMAQKLIVERRQMDVVPGLISMVNDQRIDELGLNPGAFHAIWTLSGLGAMNTEGPAVQAVRNALAHPSASIRRAALMALPRDGQLENAIFMAGLLPDRTAPGTIGENGNVLLQDADPRVLIQAILTLSELPASTRVGTALRDLIILPTNATDKWMPDAIAIAATKHNPGLALELLRRAPVQTDSVYLAGLRTTVMFVTRNLALSGNTPAIISLLEAIPGANPVLAQGVFDGIVGYAPTGPMFRTEWRIERGGWSATVPPSLTLAQRTALTAAARRAPRFASEYARVAERWSMPTLFR